VKGAIFSQLEALAFKLGYRPSELEHRGQRFAAAIAWPRVLDLYAGSGALGIEALSRGAERVDFVEADPRARRAIEANLRGTGLGEHATMHSCSAEQAISTLRGSYDLILADPPYDDLEAGRVLSRLANSPLVSERTVLIWEHGSEREPPPRLGALQLRRSRRHGAAAVSLYSADDAGGAFDGRSEN
jgi:16S rRNA (guanine(966)-N(2))-methyltransferase RsmD